MSLVKAALGQEPLHILMQGATLANVLTGETYPADIGVWGQWIACVEPPGTSPPREAATIIDGRGLLAVPGLVDSDHTLMTPDLMLEKLRLGVAVQLQERYMTSELIAAVRGLP